MMEFDDAACGPLVRDIETERKARQEVERHVSDVRERLSERAKLADKMRSAEIRASRGIMTKDATSLGVEHGICAQIARELERLP